MDKSLKESQEEKKEKEMNKTLEDLRLTTLFIKLTLYLLISRHCS